VASQGKSEEEDLAYLREALELHFEPPCATADLNSTFRLAD
jgi:predicted RNase H-like HicB family nuclease